MKSKLPLLLLLVVFIWHYQQVNGQDAGGSGETVLPVLMIGFEQSAYTYYESRQEANPQICVSVSQQSPGVTAVTEVTVTSDTAQDGVDYVFNSTQLAIDEASVRDCVTITIINDEVSEGGETLQAYLSLVYVVNNSTVRNDSNVVLTVDQANITIYDSVGFSEVPLAQTVLLNSVAVSFTCVSTPDFQAFEILWSINGQAVEFEQTPPIVQIRNVIDENTGALSSTLIVPTMLMYDNACMVCTLVSEGETSMSDPALLKLQFVTLAFEEDIYVIRETAGTLTPFIIVLDSSLPEDTTLPITVNVSTAPDLAMGGADYVPFMEIISLTDVSPGRRTSLTITIIDDNDFEPDETFFLLLNPSSPGVLVNNSMAVVIIMDDDVHVGVGFDPVVYNVSEGEMAMLRVVLNTTINETITVDLLTQDGSGIASMDYETVTRTLTFSNSTEQIISVLINADEVTENVESFTAWLTNPNPSVSAFITIPTATINIIDQEVAVVRFSSNEYTVSENDQNVQIGVQLLTATERSIVVTLTIEPGSAQSPGDYISQNTIPVTLDPESSQVFVLVTIVDDSVYNGTKFFYATISSQSERVSIAENRTRVVIRDNEVVYVWFNPVSYYVSEDAGVATLTIERTGANGIPVNISITTQDINATAGVDYEHLSVEVTFLPSLEQVVSLDLNITLIDDTSVTEELKQFQASLNTSQEGVFLTSDNQTATVNILDNDSIQIEIDFQKTDYAVSESFGSVTPIIVVEGNVSTPFDVIITAINGTASSTRDYELVQSLLTINPGTSLYQIDIAVIENDIVELYGFKNFSLVLSTTEGSVLFTNRTTVITIYDNDFSAPIITTSNISAVVVDGQSINFTCNVTTPVNGVDVMWLDGNGDVVSNSTHIAMGYNVMETIAGDSVISVLMVSSFSLSEYNQGSFSCVGGLDNPFLERVASTDTPPITSQLAAPSVNINLFPFSSRNITAGQNITVQCAISTDYGRPTDIEVTPHILWDIIYYENDGEAVMNSFEATELTNLTSAVFLSSLEYAPVVSIRNFTCRSYVEPTLSINRILVSETASDSRIVIAQAPTLSVTIDPQPVIIIADVPPYNNYTLTCNATIPRDLIHLQVSFSIYGSAARNVLANANYTPIDDCQSVMFTGDRFCTYAVTFAEVANNPDAPRRICSVELLYIDSGTSEVISIARENASVLLLVNVAAPPAPILTYHIYGVSTELAILHWIIPRIAYTPETYYIQYRLSGEEGSDTIFTSTSICGSSELSARDVEYSIVLDGLSSGTFYVANIVANNSVGGQLSRDISFATNPLDIYRVVSDIDDTIPLGAPIDIEFRFNGEGIVLPISESTQLTFYPLFHVPAIEPTNTVYNRELQQVTVSYDHVSPSMSGEYVLCQEAGPPPSRRRRGVAPEQMRPRSCGGRITITVTIPTLSISTNLLIEQYVDNTYVGGDQPPSITCLPSDTRAPVRWRLSTGVYGELSDDYLVTLSPFALNHTATFPVAYEVLPSRSAFYVCDLINVELSAGLEVSPQNVTVRFIQAEVAILNSDMELPPGAVINQFHFGLGNREPFLSLNCLSVRGHQNLEWVSRDVPSLLPDGPISSLSSANVFIDYFPESDSQQRDVVLTVTSITEGLTGYYSCRSRQSGISAEVYTTFTNPLWLRTTPALNYIPIGTALPVISVLYADVSFGYQNLGLGFSHSLTFEPYSSEPDMMSAPNQNNGSQPDSLQQPSNDRVTLISGHTSRLTGNNLTYLIIGEVTSFDGQYQLNATHLSSGEEYSDTVDVRVIVPYFAQVDELVYSRIGDLVTLTCLPNDTMATVYWMRLTGGDNTIITASDSNFLLSPPGQNYQLTFNATGVVVRTVGDDLPLQDRAYLVACAFINGENTSNLISPMNLTVQLLEERIKMITSPLEVLIRNNTVVNRFTTSEGAVGSGIVGESAPDLDLVSVGSLFVDCIAAQGDHQPVWTSDNLAISDSTGLVDSDMAVNGQMVTSNYTTRLQLGLINRQTEGNYFCRSQLSNLFTTFLLSTENPYIRAVSPTQIIITEGESATLIFLIATDSDGATWNNEAVTFSFTNRSGVEYFINSNFQDSTPDFPQFYMYTIPRVELSHAGIYTASAPRRDCSAIGETNNRCGITSASIDMTVKTYCQEQIVGGIQWPRTESNSEVSRACNVAGSLFRRGIFITRSCSETGAWSDIDFSTCTLVADSPPFLLMSFVLETEDEVSSLDDYSYLEMEMENLLRNRGILFTDVILQSTYFASISVTFEVTLPFTPAQDEQFISFSNYFSTSFTIFGNFTVRSGSRSLNQVSGVDACPCQPSSGSMADRGLNVIELCSGVSISPCNCTLDSCQCSPPFVGDGVRCTLDSDGDGYPDVALIDSPMCSDSEGTQKLYCIPDNCPMVINVDQDPFACEPETTPAFDGCPFEIDSVWDITWPNTERNSSTVQLCPGGYDALGTAMRYCNSEGQWEEANVLQCTTLEFIGLEQLAQATVAILDPEEQLMQSAELTQQLIEATVPQNRSLLPNDLQASTRVLTTVLEVLENNENATTNLNVIDIFDNMLDISQMDGWRTLQMAGLMNGSEMLLNNAERYGLLVASSVNGSDDDRSAIRQSRSNIVVTGNQYREPPVSAVRFPIPDDLVNYTKGSMDSAQINLPPSLIQERMTEMEDNAPLPVFFLLLRDIPMGVFISNSTTVPATTCMEEGTLTTTAAADVVAAQVGMGNNQFSPSQIPQSDPVSLDFSFSTVANGSLYRCVYWNFSQPIGNGSWVIAGVTTTDVTTSGNQTAIQCTSTHLTSFAVLVDVAGGLADLPDPERTALQIVSYIGCAISIVCLIGTIFFFLFQGNKLKTSVHYFVHLNLALSLLLAFTVFVVGVETAIGSTAGCAFVAALLHYLFLSAFCWMLCEGIMLYLLLIVVFSKMAKKWWPFLLIGYLPPLPIVIITVGARHQYYGVRDNCGQLLYCWLSAEQGTIFGFVAPMLAIILINVVFLIMALYTLIKTKKRQLRRKREKDEATRKTAKAIFTASIVLLPLLGLTWIFGILTVNVNTTVFAWLFTIFNSLQGAFIFFFHVVRSDQVWSKVSPKLQSLKRSTFRSTARWYDVSSSGTSTLSKGSTMKSTMKGHFGSLSRDPNSTLGRGDTCNYKKPPNVPQLSMQSPSSYELKTDLSPVSEVEDTGIESETKVDLSMPEKSASTDTRLSVIPESSLMEPPKDKDKLISEKRKNSVEENVNTKKVDDEAEITNRSVIVNPAMVSEVPEKGPANPEKCEHEAQTQTQRKKDNETDSHVDTPTSS